MRLKWNAGTKRVMQVAGAVLLGVLVLALVPVLALPYTGLDWIQYDVVYQGVARLTPTPVPPTPEPSIPCAELPQPGEPLAAQVNGQGIRLAAYERELAQLIDALAEAGEDVESEEFQAQLPDLRRQVLDTLINDVLVQQAAVEAGITVSDEEIQTNVGQAVTEAGGLATFESWLEETGQTWEEFSRDVCQELLQQRVFEEVTAGIPETVDLVWAQQIVVATEAEAITVLTRLASGELFEDVARDVSIDEATRDSGGDLGWFPVGLGWQPSELEEAAFAGAPGQVQGPLNIQGNYVVLLTVDRQPEYALTPEEWDALRLVAFERWLAEWREASEIEIFVDFEAAPDA